MSTTLFAVTGTAGETEGVAKLGAIVVSRQHQKPIRRFYAMGVARFSLSISPSS